MEFIIYPRTLSIMCNTVYYQVQRLQDLRGARNDGHYLSSSKFRTATSPWINNKIKAVSLTFFRLPLELLFRIFTFQWNAVIVSTPSLWVQLQLGEINIPPTYFIFPLTSCPSGLNDRKHVLFILDSITIRWICSIFLSLPVHLSVGKVFNSGLTKIRQISSVNAFPCLTPDNSNSFVLLTQVWRHQNTLLHS